MRHASIALLLLAASASPAAADRLLVLNKSDDTVSILDAASGKAVATVPVGRGPHEAALLADGNTAAVSDYGEQKKPGRTITLIDVAKGEKVGVIELPEGARPHGLEALR